MKLRVPNRAGRPASVRPRASRPNAPDGVRSGARLGSCSRVRARRWLALLGATLVATTAAGQIDPIASATPAAADSAAALDPNLLALRDQLARLLAGSLPESVPVGALFDVPIDDVDRVLRRVEELRGTNETQARSLAELRAALGELEAEQASDTAPQRPAETGDGIAGGVPPDEATNPAPSDDALADAGGADASLEGRAPETPTSDRASGAAETPRTREDRERAFREATIAWQARGEARAARVAALRAEIASADIRYEIARLRLDYLERLAELGQRFSDASKRILPTTARPRDAMRAHANRIAALARAADDLSRRVSVLAERSGSGMLVGFLSEQRTLSNDLEAAAEAHADQARRLTILAGDLSALADALETEGRRVRAAFFRSVARPERQEILDALFASHLKTQRLLRNQVSQSAEPAGAEALDRLLAEVASIAPAPLRIGTTRDATLTLEAVATNRLALDELVTTETIAKPSWQLAFENELMTMLREQSSDDARAEAYRFSRELLDDLSSEVRIAWQRALEGIRAQTAGFTSMGAYLRSIATETLLRLLGLVGLFAAWFYARRYNGKIVSTLVRTLSRATGWRRRIGLLVRWSGLFESALPPLLAFVALLGSVELLGGETAVARVVWIIAMPPILYVLGRQLLLGATRRISFGRPALIEIRPATLTRLQRTYANLGVVVAIAYVLDGLTRVLIGAGRLVSLIDSFVLFWVAVWIVWETIRWRVALAQNWAELAEDEPPSLEHRIAGWMEGSRVGFLLSPIAFLRILATPTAHFLGRVATQTNVVQSLRAQLLRRRSAQSESVAVPNLQDLPNEYLDAFPLYPILGEDDALLVARSTLVSGVLDQWARWKATRADGSLAVIGEKGVGKTTLAAQVSRRIQDTEVVQHTIQGKPKDGAELIADLAEKIGFDGVRDVDELTRLLCAGEDRVVVIDEVHNVFLRYVDGYRAYDALVDLVNATTSKVFWVLILNSFTWRFLNESRGRVHYFRRLLQIPRWTSEEIEQLIRLRNKRTGYELRFDEMLLSDARGGSNGFALVEEADGYFRLLWESSGGNPRIATHLWLSSLRRVGDETLAVGLFAEPSTEVLSGLQDELVFCLAAICQHENLSHRELGIVLNTTTGFARFAIQFLHESGFIEPKDATNDRFTLAPNYYRAVLRALRNKHLLYD